MNIWLIMASVMTNPTFKSVTMMVESVVDLMSIMNFARNVNV